MPTVTQKEYKQLIKRQEKIEEAIRVLNQVVRNELDEERIKPSILRRWEKISSSMDRGGGVSFASEKEMKKWLKQTSGFPLNLNAP